MLYSFNLNRIVLLCFIVPWAASAQKVSTTNDPEFDFIVHKRYAWMENQLVTRQHPDTNEVMNLKIVKSVNRTLAAKGFVEVQEKPDFFVYYDAAGASNVAAKPVAQANSTPIQPTDRAPSYALGNGPVLAPGTWLKVYGQISFHIIDVPSKKQVWSAIYKKTFHDPDKALRNMDKEVSELVTKSFKDFPPKH